MSKVGRISAFDAVRGIAAFIVVIHHCFLTRPVYSNYFFTGWKTPATGLVSSIFLYTPARIVWAGYEAVTLFYVLSGLVLALPWLEGRAPKYTQFALRRMCRLYIPYVAAIAAAGLLNIALLQHAYVSGASAWVNEDTWTHPVTLSLIFDHLAVIGHHYTIDGVTHTLIWEIRISLLFPLLIVPIRRWGVRGALAVWMCLLAIMVGVQLFCGDIRGLGNLMSATHEMSVLQKLAIELQWNAYYATFFVYGCLLAAWLTQIRLFLARSGAWLSFVLLFSGLFAFQAHWSQWAIVQEFMVAVASVLILCAALAPGKIETALLSRAPRYLGKISFSLYLVHVPVILTLTILTRGRLPLPVLLAIVVPVSIMLAAIFDRLVTAPAANLGHSLGRPVSAPRFAPQPILEEGRL